jgi:hypothetical protein
MIFQELLIDRMVVSAAPHDPGTTGVDPKRQKPTEPLLVNREF